MIQAQHGAAIKRHFVDEVHERAAQVGQVAVVVQVFCINVGNDRDGGRELQKRAVRLVGFCNHVLGLTQACPGPQLRQLAPDDCGWVKPCFAQHRRAQRSRGGLAMRARNRNAHFVAHQLRQHLGAGDDRNAARPSAADLRVITLDGAGNDDDIGVGAQ